MAQTFNRKTLQSGYSSVDLINENFEAIETALQDVLSRSGVSPNAMAADLDMNSNRILNLPTPVNGAEPATYAQLLNLATSGGLTLTGWAPEEQTATAGQTSFTLTLLSYVPGNNSLRVYINGTRQHSGYTETSATQVDFDTGLQAGDAVLFEAFSTAISTDAVDSSNVTYSHGGTGASNTNVKSKLQKVIHVSDYGAVGDDSTDDSTSIQRADTASVNGTLNFDGSKTYRLTSSVACTGDWNLNGATLHFVVTGDVKCLEMLTSNSKVYNGTIKLTGSGTPSSGEYQSIIKVGSYVSLTNGPSNVSIENITITKAGASSDTNGVAIFGNSNNISIRNLKASDASTLGRVVMAHWSFDGVDVTNGTSHPSNIVIDNVDGGSQTLNVTNQSIIFLSGSHAVTAKNIHATRVAKAFIRIDAGDYGYTYAGTDIVDMALHGLSFENCLCEQVDANTGEGVKIVGRAGVDSSDWYADPVFTNVVIKGTGSSSTVNGFEFDTVDGAKLINCRAQECLFGIATAARVRNLHVIGGEYSENENDGASITNGTTAPQDVVFDNVYFHDNDKAGSTGAGITIADAHRVRVFRCRLGNVSGVDATQDYGIEITTAGRGHSVCHNHFFVGTRAVSVGTGTGQFMQTFEGNSFASGMTISNGDNTAELVISSGVITVVPSAKAYYVDTELDAATDDLDTISGGFPGQIITLIAANSGRTVVCKDGTGNLRLTGDFSLDNQQDTIMLQYLAGAWQQIATSNNGA